MRETVSSAVKITVSSRLLSACKRFLRGLLLVVVLIVACQNDNDPSLPRKRLVRSGLLMSGFLSASFVMVDDEAIFPGLAIGFAENSQKILNLQKANYRSYQTSPESLSMQQQRSDIDIAVNESHELQTREEAHRLSLNHGLMPVLCESMVSLLTRR